MAFVDTFRLGPLFKFLHQHQIVDESGKVVGYTELNVVAIESQFKLSVVSIPFMGSSSLPLLPPPPQPVRIPADRMRAIKRQITAAVGCLFLKNLFFILE